ncbi:MAG: carotenoid biosynthesis protein [Chlorobi bacterium]|nr:carotenoid biosynthesis protein [Chlorobiota bacterium]
MNGVRRLLVGLFVVLLVGGALTSAAESDVGVLRRYGEMLFLWIAAGVIVVHRHPQFLRLLVGALIGFASEIIGVATGVPFGHYHYTDTLGLAIAGVPLVMVAAWLVLLAYAWTWATLLTERRWIARAIGALAMMLYDLLVDPVAIGPMTLWVWDQAGFYYGVPLVNFVGWFLVSFVAMLPLRTSSSVHRMSHAVGVSVIAFFTVVALRSGIVLAGSIGALLLVADATICRSLWMQYFAQWQVRVRMLNDR